MALLERHHYAWLSIAAAVATIALKTLAWWLTGSVGLLSDALESFVNLAGAGFALRMLLVTRTPPDGEHPFGHGKAEYFSSGFEGFLILGAAVGIVWAAAVRFMAPAPIESAGWGVVWSAAATAINFGVARVLGEAGRRFNSIALRADSRHLMSDVWTSAGVILGVALVAWTGWLRLDPLIAMAVGAHIAREAWSLLRESVDGLMDRSLDAASMARVHAALDAYLERGVRYAGLRTRQAGASSFLQVVVQVPGDWTVQHGHALLDEIEADLTAAIPGLDVTTHLAPLP